MVLHCGAGAKLKQKAALVAAPAPALDVLEDAELAEAPAAEPAPAPAGTLRRRLDGGALQEGLLHDPLRLHKVRFVHLTSLLCHRSTSQSHLCTDPRLACEETQSQHGNPFAFSKPPEESASKLLLWTMCMPKR